MHKLLISATLASFMVVAGTAWAQDAHHDHATPPPAAAAPAPKPMAMDCSRMHHSKLHAKHAKGHKMNCMKKGGMMDHSMKGMHDMSGMKDGHQMMGGTMDAAQMKKMHGQMGQSGMMGSKPAPTPSPTAPK